MDHQHPHQHTHEHTDDERGDGGGLEDDGQREHDHVAHRENSSTPLDPSDAVPAQTLLPVVRQPDGYPTGMLVLDDADQLIDHGGKAVPPVTDAGMPYRYKVRLAGRSAYATTADEMLALFVPDYPLPTPGDTRTKQEIALDLVRSRGQHCLGVMVNHVALAILGGELTSEEEQLLQRSAELDETGPITAAHCQRWTHPDVAMLLMGDLYARVYDRYTPPAGNVVFLFPGTAERYLAGLAELGLLALSENPAWTAAPLVEVSAR